LGRLSDGVYRYETRTSTKIRPGHGSALRGPDNDDDDGDDDDCVMDTNTMQQIVSKIYEDSLKI